MNTFLRRSISLLLTAVMLFSLGVEAFADTLTLPASLTDIQAEAFYGDESLDEVVVPYGTQTIGARAFADSGVTRIDLPETVFDIDPSAFDGLSDAFMIYAPKYSYAYEYAVNRHLNWADPLMSGLEEAMAVIDEEFLDGEDAAMTIDDMSFVPLSTQEINDPEELRLVEEYNALLEQSAALHAEMIQTRDDIRGMMIDFLDFASENSMDLTDEGFTLSTGNGVFSVPTAVLESLADGMDLSQIDVLEDDSVILELQNENGVSTFVKLDGNGLSLADDGDVEEVMMLRASGLRAPNDPLSLPEPWESLMRQIDAFDNICDIIGIFASEFEYRINTWLQQAIEGLEKAEGQYNKAIVLRNTSGNLRYSAEAIKAEAQLTIARASLTGATSISNYWTSLKIAGSVAGVVSDLNMFHQLSIIAQHGHPTVDELQVEEKAELARELQTVLTHARVALVARVAVSLIDIGMAIQTLVTFISACSGPAGLGLAVVAKAAALTITERIKRVIGAAILTLAENGAKTYLLNKVVSLDNYLHAMISEGTVKGHIYDAQTGQPISGVLVTYGSVKTATDEKGAYSFTAPCGSQALTFEKTGYDKDGLALIISKTETICDRHLKPGEKQGYAISGMVTDKNTGAALSNAQVTIDGIRSVSTDASGRYSFSDLVSGSHTLSFSLADYSALSVTVSLLNKDATYNARLTSTKPSPTPTPTAAPTPTPTNPPSGEFWAWCVIMYDTDRNGSLSQAEMNAVSTINICDYGFESLDGIERFRNIQRLYCDGNQLTSLNVSGCTALQELRCDDNPLVSLNASGCTALQELWCDDQQNQLTSLDVSGCTSLSKLYCDGNQLTSLNVSGCTSLDWLECSYNQLTSLDVSSCTALGSLGCHNNQLISLNASGCTSLQLLHCWNNQLTRLNLSGCTALISLSCYNNQLTDLDLSDCTALLGMDCRGNQFSSLDVSSCIRLHDLSCDDGIQIITTPIPFWAWAVREFDNNSDGRLSQDEIDAVINIYCANNEFKSLDGIERFRNLQNLDCSGNQLTDLDLSGCTALQKLWCKDNQLTSLNISGCSALQVLQCSNNQLTSLNVTGYTALQELDCCENQLTSLNITGCTALQELYCYDNQLTSLNVTGYTALQELYCNENQLTSLNTTGCTALQELYCYGNQLTSLNTTSCTALQTLWCDGNQLTSLDVSGRPALKALWCSDNQLSSLNISGCTALQSFYCDGNQLSSINVSGCTALQQLVCYDNQLTSLNVSGCTALEVLSCSENKLTNLDVSGCAALQRMWCYSNQLTSLIVTGCTALRKLDCTANRMTTLNVSGCVALTELECDEGVQIIR